jgi:hypothetical protein
MHVGHSRIHLDDLNDEQLAEYNNKLITQPYSGCYTNPRFQSKGHLQQVHRGSLYITLSIRSSVDLNSLTSVRSFPSKSSNCTLPFASHLLSPQLAFFRLLFVSTAAVATVALPAPDN